MLNRPEPLDGFAPHVRKEERVLTTVSRERRARMAIERESQEFFSSAFFTFNQEVDRNRRQTVSQLNIKPTKIRLRKAKAAVPSIKGIGSKAKVSNKTKGKEDEMASPLGYALGPQPTASTPGPGATDVSEVLRNVSPVRAHTPDDASVSMSLAVSGSPPLRRSGSAFASPVRASSNLGAYARDSSPQRSHRASIHNARVAKRGIRMLQEKSRAAMQPKRIKEDVKLLEMAATSMDLPWRQLQSSVPQTSSAADATVRTEMTSFTASRSSVGGASTTQQSVSITKSGDSPSLDVVLAHVDVLDVASPEARSVLPNGVQFTSLSRQLERVVSAKRRVVAVPQPRVVPIFQSKATPKLVESGQQTEDEGLVKSRFDKTGTSQQASHQRSSASWQGSSTHASRLGDMDSEACLIRDTLHRSYVGDALSETTSPDAESVAAHRVIAPPSYMGDTLTGTMWGS